MRVTRNPQRGLPVARTFYAHQNHPLKPHLDTYPADEYTSADL
jgi:hypothetical protein